MCLFVFSCGLAAIKASPEIDNRTGAANIAPVTAETITYITDKKWDPKPLLYGRNGLDALTFCEFPLEMNAR